MIRRLLVTGALASATLALVAPTAGTTELLSEHLEPAPGIVLDVTVVVDDTDHTPAGTRVDGEVLGTPIGAGVEHGGEDEHLVCAGMPDYGVPTTCAVPL